LVVVLALLIGLDVCGFRDRILGGASAPRIESLAVLPLENLSGDPEQEYFADGMTEALIAELGQLKALRVISRTSVMMYKGARKPLRDIAQELDVEVVVEGSVVRSGERVRITTQLVQAVPEKHLWAESYERELGDVLRLQSEIAQSIAREIQITVSPEEQRRLADARQVVPEVYEAYLRGRHFQDERTYEGLRRSMEYFRKATDTDPAYAPAWAGMADTYNLQIFWGFTHPNEVFPQYKEAVMKALELDDDLAEAHATLADLKWFENWDWNGAEMEFKRALELNPSYANAHSWYANLLTEKGRAEEAIERRKQAQRLDPLSPILNVAVVGDMYMAGRYEDALAQFDQNLELSPGFPLANYLIGLCHEQLSRMDEAIQSLKKAREGFEGSSLVLGALGHAYATSGNRRHALEIIAELEQLSEREHVSAFDFAIVYVGLGENQQALDWLERAYEDRTGWVEYIKVDPRLKHLHTEPRFQELLRRMNLAD
jgi:TolB-like protein/Tfp pilus assembly protein PilF